jgi:Outer membrane efflux protein
VLFIASIGYQMKSLESRILKSAAHWHQLPLSIGLGLTLPLMVQAAGAGAAQASDQGKLPAIAATRASAAVKRPTLVNEPPATSIQPAALAAVSGQPAANMDPVTLNQPAAGTQVAPGAPIEADQEFSFTGLDLPHDQNNKLGMDQLRLHNAVHGDSFKPIRLEVQYDESINLEDALKYAVENNLAIKISKDNLKYQHFVLYGQFANTLPNLTMAYNLTHTKIINDHTTSLAKVFLTRVTYPVFQGGSVLYGILGQYYREKGWKQAYKASISDELLDLYQKYNAVLLDRILLQIRAKAVEVSEEQLRINKAMDAQGSGTRYQVAQADAQLSSDKQALLQQQVTMRQAALALNFTMNYPMAVNLVPVEETIVEEPLFQSEATIDSLVNYALLNRPELREYEDFKIAAARNVQVAAAPLYHRSRYSVSIRMLART